MKKIGNKFLMIIVFTMTTIIVFTIAIIIVCILPMIRGGLYFSGIFPLAPNEKKMEGYFNESLSELSYVVASLSQMDEYDYIAIRKTEGSHVMYVSNTEYMENTDIVIGSIQNDVSISDVTLIDNIEKLYEQGFEAIIKSENDYILFSRWSSLSSSRGIVFSMTNQEPDIEFLICLKSFSIEGWYYYETNYEKFR